MEATYTITERDYVRAIMLFSKLTRKVAILVLAVYLALAVAVVILSVPLWLLAIGGIVGVSYHFTITPYVSRRHYRKYKAIQGPITVQLKDEGVWIQSEDGSTIVKWEKIYRWRQNNNYVLIYLMPRLFYIIPKTVTESGFDLSSLIETLQTKVGKAT